MAAAGPSLNLPMFIRPALGVPWRPPDLEVKAPMQVASDFEMVEGTPLFECVVCYEHPLLADIRCCDQCGVCVCRSCALKWRNEQHFGEEFGQQSTCPQCRAYDWSAMEVAPTALAKRMMSKVNMRCRACKESVTQSSREQHDCRAKLACPFDEQHDRPWMLTPSTLASHLETYHAGVQLFMENSTTTSPLTGYAWNMLANPFGFIIMYTNVPGYVSAKRGYASNEFTIKCSPTLNAEKVVFASEQVSYTAHRNALFAGPCKFSVPHTIDMSGFSICVALN